MAGLAIKSAAAVPTKYGVVTGANKGIGFEICKQLASRGISVLLTARNRERGLDAVERLGMDNITFHELDVLDSASVHALAAYLNSQIGKLDILVNNAGANGITNSGPGKKTEYELAEECIQTNYYGTKRTIEGLLPLLHLSDSPRIVNVSSTMGTFGSNRDLEKLTVTEEGIDELLAEFLHDLKEGSLRARGWPTHWGAYCVSKAAVTQYTKLLAEKHPRMLINSVCPGWVNTDLSNHSGPSTPEEGASSPVNLALLPDGGPSGLFFH
ncbi:(+)-neomenthol dehydrogenase-like [Andrographis paniculata]|uniref:(+)-neomenthol dehydrogenase-like n=1 Tax=Andrographis paniculata TaxID=175694 RepID=UPI0021E96552|nr:(+)-neomenthol dehydrogenase-like [Andrographis paniculata]